MNNRYFNKGFYLEMFSQMKIVGIFGMVIYTLAGILYPIGMIIEEMNYPSEHNEIYFPIEYFYILYGLVFVGIPLLMLVGFSYLNKRKSSDFYHAIPVRREAMFISGMAATFTWVVMILIVACVFTLAIVGIDGKLTIEISMFSSLFKTVIVTCIQVASVFALGIALTGNSFSSVLISLMIMFAPRVIIMIIMGSIQELVPFSVVDYGNSILNLNYNAVYMVVSGGIIDFPVTMEITDTYIYTIILSIVYIILACVAFVKRRSETASDATSYKIVQDISKMIPSYVCSLFAILLILMNMYGDYEVMNYFGSFVLMVIAVVAYFIYDIVTTKKAKRVLINLKQLPIFLGIVFISGVVVVGGVEIGIKREVDANKIKEIRVIDADNLLTFLGYEKIELDDDEINKIIEMAYERQMKNSKVYTWDWDGTSVVIGIKQGLTTFYREIYLKDDELKQLKIACIEACTEQKGEINLPKYSPRFRIDVDYQYIIEREYEDDLYNCLRDELKTVTYKDYIDSSDEECLAYIYINKYDYDWGYAPSDGIRIPINSLLPKTKNKILELQYRYIEEIAEDEEDSEEDKWLTNTDFRKWIKKIQENSFTIESVDINTIGTSANVEHPTLNYINMKLTSDDECKYIISLFEKISKEDENATEYIYLDFNISGLDNEGYYSDYHSEICYKVTEETAKEIMDVFSEYVQNEEYYYEY